MINDQLFKFEKSDIESYIRYDMKLFKEMRKSFNFIYDKMIVLGFNLNINSDEVVDLEKQNWDEGKNYHWLAITSGDVKLLIRAYGNHFTIFSKLYKIEKYDEIELPESIYSAFTFYTNRDHMTDKLSDFYVDNRFHDINNALLEIINIVKNKEVQSMWNPYSFTRPEHCEVKNVFNQENVVSIDKLIYCAEELSFKHTELFAENDMFEILKNLSNKVGQQFDNRQKIDYIEIEFSKEYSDPYYNGIGIGLIDEKGEKTFKDLYCLTHWYTDNIEKLINL
jgi:hypothetical protein